MKFVAFERNKQGTGASRRLRITGKTPGIVYGGSGEPQLIELDHNALWHALKKEAFHSSVLEMELAGQVSKVLLRDVQMHPFRQQVLHIDFQRVDARTRMNLNARNNTFNQRLYRDCQEMEIGLSFWKRPSISQRRMRQT
ncbi:MAG: 50S ribosomal protein L25 [Nibricoccus sp.]